MNIRAIRKTIDDVLMSAAAAADRLDRVPEPTEAQEDRRAALDDFIAAIEAAIDELEAAYAD